MPIGTKLVGDQIRDTLKNQPPQEDWSQFLPQPQGPLIAPPSPSQDLSCLDKCSVTHLPMGNEEWAQAKQVEEPQKRSIDEVLEEGKIDEEPQQTSQDIELRTMESKNTEMHHMDLSQKEKTLERSG